MSNNRLHLVDRVSGKRVLLAKGWERGWEVFKENTLGLRLTELFEHCASEGRELGSTFQEKTDLAIEIETTPEIRKAVIVIENCKKCPSFNPYFDPRIQDVKRCLTWSAVPENTDKVHPEFEDDFSIPEWCPNLYEKE